MCSMAVDGTTQFNVCQILVEVTGWLFLRIRSRASRKIRLGMCPVRKEQHSGVILRIRGGFRSSGQARVGLLPCASTNIFWFLMRSIIRKFYEIHLSSLWAVQRNSFLHFFLTLFLQNLLLGFCILVALQTLRCLFARFLLWFRWYFRRSGRRGEALGTQSNGNTRFRHCSGHGS